MKSGVVKFDCLYTDDDKLYESKGIPVKKVYPVLFALTIISSVTFQSPLNGGAETGRRHTYK